jgi:hypothetical protein
MTSKLRKAAIGALAALSLGVGVTATATPSAAQGWREGGRWHGGYWNRGYGWHGGYGWGAPAAAGILGGLALGAIAGSGYSYGGPAYYGGCSWQNRPVYDSWGNFAGYAPVQVCY